MKKKTNEHAEAVKMMNAALKKNQPKFNIQADLDILKRIVRQNKGASNDPDFVQDMNDAQVLLDKVSRNVSCLIE